MKFHLVPRRYVCNVKNPGSYFSQPRFASEICQSTTTRPATRVLCCCAHDAVEVARVPVKVPARAFQAWSRIPTQVQDPAIIVNATAGSVTPYVHTSMYVGLPHVCLLYRVDFLCLARAHEGKVFFSFSLSLKSENCLDLGLRSAKEKTRERERGGRSLPTHFFQKRSKSVHDSDANF